MSILDTIVAKKKIENADLASTIGIDALQEAAKDAKSRASFYEALAKPGVQLIAELKKASPSKGVIRESFQPKELALEFQQIGAAALSVLTDVDFFQGSPDYLTQVADTVSIPLLRKEFIIDPIQVYHAKVLGASAILLIKAILSDDQAKELMAVAAECGLDVLMEIHSAEELDAVKGLPGLKILGVNNRDLRHFETDTAHVLALAEPIRQAFSDDVLIVAESGYHTVDQLQELEKHHIDAVLIGEGLARYPELQSFWAK